MDLPGGWYAFSIDYMNRWGSTNLLAALGTASDYAPVPKLQFRSRDASGSFVAGLRADYYNLAYTPNPGTLNPENFSSVLGSSLGTVYGEGPIARGYSAGYHYEYQAAPG